MPLPAPPAFDPPWLEEMRRRRRLEAEYRERWGGRWGLRRRLTFMFAFVALAAVFITTWFTLGAVSSVLFAGADPGGFGWKSWQESPSLDLPQFAQAREAFSRITGTAFVAGTVAFLLALLVAALVTRALTRPLMALTDGAKRFEAGQRGIRLRVPRSRDELRGLTEAFNNLVSGLERQEQWRKGLIADIAHDLRTPLSVLRSEIEAMQDGVVATDAAALERLHAQTLLLTKLVSDLRTLSLAESGGLELRLEEVNLSEFLSEVLGGFRPQGVVVASQVSPQLTARIDRVQMTRVLNNLLDNAVRHSGSNRIEVSAGQYVDSVRVAVRDFGRGIPQEQLERVFERFYKADASRTKRDGDAGGSGLGLSIARAIVEAHGGKLEAANHADGGAVFTVWLRQ
ncbi:MAG: ATP-binding protein [Meiothermus sp.]|nr:ATP-binding protein [Meiothermus sp.]